MLQSALKCFLTAHLIVFLNSTLIVFLCVLLALPPPARADEPKEEGGISERRAEQGKGGKKLGKELT